MLHGDSDILGFTRRIHNQYVIEYNETQTSVQGHSVLATTMLNRYVWQSRRLQQPAWANSDLWHKCMGHLDPAALTQLGHNTLGVRLWGLLMAKCPHCALAKVTQQISHH